MKPCLRERRQVRLASEAGVRDDLEVQSRYVLLLVEKCSHCFSWYDPESGERLRSLRLPDFPHEFVTDSANRFAYVGHYGVETSGHPGPGGHSVLQIDIRSGELVRTINLYPFNRIHGLQIDAQDRLYALSEEKATLLVLDNPATDDTPRRAVPSGGIKSHLFALTRDGQAAYCMNLLKLPGPGCSPQSPKRDAIPDKNAAPSATRA